MGNVPEGASKVINELASLLSCDGAQGMFWTISIILGAMCFGGIVDCTGIMGSFAGILLEAGKKAEADWFWLQNSSCLFVNAISSRPVLILSITWQNVQGSLRRFGTASKTPFLICWKAPGITIHLFPLEQIGGPLRVFLRVDSG